jgi:hypothetical protein
MPDFPGGEALGRTIASSTGLSTLAGQASISAASAASTAAVWPAANRAIYIPFEIDYPATAFQMAFVVGTQSGNYDAGIYSETGTRLVSLGSTAVPIAGIATANFADTALLPGTYFMALNIDNTTAAVARTGGLPIDTLRTCGVQQQAVGAVALPVTATFANPASAYMPQLLVALVATV